MSGAIAGAFEAIKLANKATGAIKDDAQEGSLQGRKVRHWSFWVLLTGAALGAAAVVAASIMSLIPIIVAGALLLATNAIGAYYIKKFYPLMELEGYVKVMITKIKEMSQYIDRLKQTAAKLRGTADDLGKNLIDTAKVWEQGNKGIEDQAHEIERLTNKLEVTTKKLKKMEEMYTNLQNALNIFSNDVATLTQHRKDISDNVAVLANQVTDAKEVVKDLQIESDEFDGNNEKYDQLNKANLDFLEALHQELKQFLQMHADAKAITHTLETQGDVLSKVSQEITQSLKNMEDLEQKEGDMKEKAEKLARKTEKLTKSLTEMVAQLEKKKQQSVKG